MLCYLGRSKDADGNFSFLKDNSPSKDLTKEGEQELIVLLCIFSLSLRPSHPIVRHNLTECERVIVSLLVEDILHPNIVYTAYNTIVYLRLGPRGQACLNSKNLSVEIDLPLRTNKKAAASSKKSLAETDENGWISRTTQTNKTKSKKRTSKTASKTQATKAKKSKTTKKTSSKRKSAKSKMPTIVDIVEIDSSSSSSSESDDEMVLAKRASRNKKQKVIFEESSDDDSEFELSD